MHACKIWIARGIDFMPDIDAGRGVGETLYLRRRRQDFFVRNFVKLSHDEIVKTQTVSINRLPCERDRIFSYPHQ